MEWHVHSLNHVERRHRDVIVILLAWNAFPTPIAEEIRRHSTEFGHCMSYRGVLVLPYADAMRDAREDVLRKAWPEAVRARLADELHPFLLVIEKDFAAFDPAADRHALVWFSDLKDDPGKVWEVLGALAQRVERREDVFAYLEAVATAAQQGRLADQLATLSRFVEVKLPVIPGLVSVNAGSIWAALMQRLRPG